MVECSDCPEHWSEERRKPLHIEIDLQYLSEENPPNSVLMLKQTRAHPQTQVSKRCSSCAPHTRTHTPSLAQQHQSCKREKRSLIWLVETRLLSEKRTIESHTHGTAPRHATHWSINEADVTVAHGQRRKTQHKRTGSSHQKKPDRSVTVNHPDQGNKPRMRDRDRAQRERLIFIYMREKATWRERQTKSYMERETEKEQEIQTDNEGRKRGKRE